MSLSYKRIKKAAFLYLSLPLLVFLLGYLRWYYGVPLSGALVFAWVCAVRDTNVLQERSQEIVVSRGIMLSLGILVLLWSFLGGLNGHFYQNGDWASRNAIYRDLIKYPWAVRYQNGNALNYYIGFWLVPALVAKLGMLFTDNWDVVWEIARNALWLWTAVGLYLTVLLLIVYVRASGKAQQLAVFAFFAFFSGMDILGVLWLGLREYVLRVPWHLEWWAVMFQYSSVTTCLYWVFNQTVLSWLAVICFMFEKDARNYLLIGLTCMICGPFPFVGLVMYMAAQALIDLVRNIRNKQVSDSLKAAFSPANLLLVLAVVPVTALFYSGNSATAAGAGRTQEMLPSLLDMWRWKRLIAFCGIEVGMYFFFLWKRNLKNPMFYVIGVSMLIFPNIYVGQGADFCMRASVPGIFILCAWFSEYVLEMTAQWKRTKTLDKLCCAGLLIVFLLGAVTPGVEIARGLHYVHTEGTIELEDRRIETLGNMSGVSNFLALDCDSIPFYRYLAR